MIEFIYKTPEPYFVLTKSACSALLEHMSKDRARANLTQAEFDFSTRQIAATTGHTLLVWSAQGLPETTSSVQPLIRSRGLEQERTYLSRDLLTQAGRLASKKVDVHVFADRVVVGDVTLAIPRLGVPAFPAVVQVVPNGRLLRADSGAFCQLSAQYIASATCLGGLVYLGHAHAVTLARHTSMTLLFGGSPTGPYAMLAIMDVGPEGASDWAHVLSAREEAK
jgi:hypothetical protein